MRVWRPICAGAAVAAILAIVTTAAVCVGAPMLSPVDALASIGDPDSMTFLRAWELRAPRAVIAIVVGSAFAAAGLLLQHALANPLAVPELLGVSSGAAAAVAVLVVTGVASAAPWFPLLALAGALLGTVLTLMLVQGSRDPSQVLLIGAATASALGSLTVVAASMAQELQLQSLLRYLTGSLVGLGWDAVSVIVPWVVAALAIGVCFVPVARVLSLGDDAASAVGVSPGRARLTVLVIACLLVAAPTAYVGPIAWIGFAGPQLARRLPVSRRLREGAMGEVLLTTTVGGCLVLAADVAARTVFAPVETPLGAWTVAAALALVLVTTASRLRVVLRRGSAGSPG